jgi:hypothetical protein
MNIDQVLSRANLESLGCQFWIPFNNDVYDYSGNASVTNDSLTFHKQKDGKRAAYNSGTYSYRATVPYSDISIANTSFTLMSWVNIPSVTVNRTLFCSTGGNTNYQKLHILGHSTGTIYYDFWGTGWVGNETIPLDEWFHLTCDYNHSTKQARIIINNGTPDEYTMVSSLTDASRGLYICGGDLSSWPMQGYMKDTMLFTGVLDTNVRRKLYNATYIE